MRALLARRGTRNRRGQGTTERRLSWSPPRCKAPRSATVCRWRGSPNCTWCTVNRRKKERGWPESTWTKPTVHQPCRGPRTAVHQHPRPASWPTGPSPAPAAQEHQPSSEQDPATRPSWAVFCQERARAYPPWPRVGPGMRPRWQIDPPLFSFFFSFSKFIASINNVNPQMNSEKYKTNI